MHSLEKLVSILRGVPLSSYIGNVYRVVPDRWRSSPLSTIGAAHRGGRYNPPDTFSVLYTADSQFTALREVEALFIDAEGHLQGVPRDPDLIVTIDCVLSRVLDLTSLEVQTKLGFLHEELVALIPSRFIANARGDNTPTQQLGLECSNAGNISAIKAPSAANPDGYCVDILLNSLSPGEHIAIRDESGRLREEIAGD